MGSAARGQRRSAAVGGLRLEQIRLYRRLTLAAIGPGEEVHFIEFGRGLTEELGRSLTAVGGETEGMDEAYRRCARKAEPTHEFLRFDFGDGDPLTFERLLAPFCANGGQKTTHVVGIAIIDGATRPPG